MSNKQISMFGAKETLGSKKYNMAVGSPVYEPTGVKPHVMELIDLRKTKRLEEEIKAADIDNDIKHFLLRSAQRHSVFNYEKIAEYYAHSSPEVQDLMERSALVIIDFHKAIELGYVQLTDSIRRQYMEELANENQEEE